MAAAKKSVATGAKGAPVKPVGRFIVLVRPRHYEERVAEGQANAAGWPESYLGAESEEEALDEAERILATAAYPVEVCVQSLDPWARA